MELQKIRLQLKELVPDFAKRVAPIYKQLRWEWRPGNIGFVPSEDYVTRELYRLIGDVELDEGEGNVATGGLKVFSEAPSDFDTCWNIGLSFELKHVAIIGTEGRSIATSGKC